MRNRISNYILCVEPDQLKSSWIISILSQLWQLLLFCIHRRWGKIISMQEVEKSIRRRWKKFDWMQRATKKKSFECRRQKKSIEFHLTQHCHPIIKWKTMNKIFPSSIATRENQPKIVKSEREYQIWVTAVLKRTRVRVAKFINGHWINAHENACQYSSMRPSQPI